MKQTQELVPFIATALRSVANKGDYPADALRETADEADYPTEKYSWEWTEAQYAAYQFAVDLAERIEYNSFRGLGECLLDTLKTHAEAARDAASEEK